MTTMITKNIIGAEDADNNRMIIIMLIIVIAMIRITITMIMMIVNLTDENVYNSFFLSHATNSVAFFFNCCPTFFYSKSQDVSLQPTNVLI